MSSKKWKVGVLLFASMKSKVILWPLGILMVILKKIWSMGFEICDRLDFWIRTIGWTGKELSGLKPMYLKRCDRADKDVLHATPTVFASMAISRIIGRLGLANRFKCKNMKSVSDLWGHFHWRRFPDSVSLSWDNDPFHFILETTKRAAGAEQRNLKTRALSLCPKPKSGSV